MAQEKKKEGPTQLNLAEQIPPKSSKKPPTKPKASTKKATSEPKKDSKPKPTAKKPAKTTLKLKTPKAKHLKPVVSMPGNVTNLDAYLYFEGRDDEALQRELKGEEPGQWCYAFRSRKKVKDNKGQFKKNSYGKPVYEEFGPVIIDLSIAGYKEVRLMHGAIQFPLDKMRTEHSDDGKITIFVEVKDMRSQSTYIGSGTAAKVNNYYGQVTPDPFAVQKALSKAERNATRGIVSQELIDIMIQGWLITNANKGSLANWNPSLFPEPYRRAVVECRELAGVPPQTKTGAPAKTTPAPVKKKEDGAPADNAQRRALFACARDYGYNHDDIKDYIKAAWDLESTKLLTRYQFQELFNSFRESTFGTLIMNYRNLRSESKKKTA